MALERTVAELVRAGFSGIWIDSYEAHEAVDALQRIAAEQSWGCNVWDSDHWLKDVSGVGPGPQAVLNWFKQLAAEDAPRLLLLKNFHRWVGAPDVCQILQNCLVRGKQISRHIIVIAPVVQLPPEVEKLFTVVHHELPDRKQLRDVCQALTRDNGLAEQPDAAVALAVDAASGLTRVEAENAFALSLSRHRELTPEVIWNLKAQTLEKAGMLSLYRGPASFNGLGGLANLKEFCLRAMRKQNEPDPEKRAHGVLLLSPPGCGKSQFAKALGNEVGRPTVMLDFGALMGRLVGESEGNMRRALALVDAMAPCILFVDEIEKALAGTQSSGQTDSGVTARLFGTLLTWLNDHKTDVFFIGTCNDSSKLPPEFTRAERFDGVFFVDLPDDNAKEYIWNLYLTQFELDPNQQKPDHTNWTGAEIKSCCRLAALLDVSLMDAAQNVVPVAVTNSDAITNLRTWADGRCLSADNKGIFRRSSGGDTPAKSSRRKVTPSAN